MKMKAIHLQTPFGLDFWNKKTGEYTKSKVDYTSFNQFRNDCKNSANVARTTICNFLDKPKLHPLGENDIESWKIFKELNDRYQVLDYYAKRVK